MRSHQSRIRRVHVGQYNNTGSCGGRRRKRRRGVRGDRPRYHSISRTHRHLLYYNAIRVHVSVSVNTYLSSQARASRRHFVYKWATYCINTARVSIWIICFSYSSHMYATDTTSYKHKQLFRIDSYGCVWLLFNTVVMIFIFVRQPHTCYHIVVCFGDDILRIHII